MSYFTIESDRDVFVDGIGLLEAGKPIVVTEEQSTMFEKLNNQKIQGANFPQFVKVTANLGDPESEGDE